MSYKRQMTNCHIKLSVYGAQIYIISEIHLIFYPNASSYFFCFMPNRIFHVIFHFFPVRIRFLLANDNWSTVKKGRKSTTFVGGTSAYFWFARSRNISKSLARCGCNWPSEFPPVTCVLDGIFDGIRDFIANYVHETNVKSGMQSNVGALEKKSHTNAHS
jgi:hypothetical protein